MIYFLRGLAAFAACWGGLNAIAQDWRGVAMWNAIAMLGLMIAFAIHDWRGG